MDEEKKDEVIRRKVTDDKVERYISAGKRDFDSLKGKIKDPKYSTYHAIANPFGGASPVIDLDESEVSPKHSIKATFYDGPSLTDATDVYNELVAKMDETLKGWTPEITSKERTDRTKVYTSPENHEVIISLLKFEAEGDGVMVDWSLDVLNE